MNCAVSSLARFATCAAVAAAFGIGTPHDVAAADTQVMGQLTLSLGSGDWSVGIRAGAERRTSHIESAMLPLVDLTARFSGPGARFEALRFNGHPVAIREPVQHAADGAEDTDAGVQWEYAALGVAGAAAAVLVIYAAIAKDAADEIVDDILDD